MDEPVFSSYMNSFNDTNAIKKLYKINGKSFNNLAFLRKVQRVEQKLSEYTEEEQKDLISEIAKALQTVITKPAYRKAATYWAKKANMPIPDNLSIVSKWTDCKRKTFRIERGPIVVHFN